MRRNCFSEHQTIILKANETAAWLAQQTAQNEIWIKKRFTLYNLTLQLWYHINLLKSSQEQFTLSSPLLERIARRWTESFHFEFNDCNDFRLILINSQWCSAPLLVFLSLVLLLKNKTKSKLYKATLCLCHYWQIVLEFNLSAYRYIALESLGETSPGEK